jgi:hypothetical protein
MTIKETLISITPTTPSITHSSTQVENCKKKRSLITSVAKTALIEFAVSLAFAAVTIAFVSTPLSIAIVLISATTVVLFNAIVRGICASFHYRAFLLRHLPEKHIDRIKASNRAKNFEVVSSALCPVAFGQIDSNTRDLVTHEAGHALASMAMYKNARPEISINADTPLNASGMTRWYPQKLTSLGEKVGSDNASLIVGGAGAALSLTFSVLNIVVAHKLKDTHPKLSLYFLVSAITSITRHVVYALSALWTKNRSLSHDFFRLSVGGIHPLLSTACLILIPLFVKMALVFSEIK